MVNIAYCLFGIEVTRMAVLVRTIAPASLKQVVSLPPTTTTFTRCSSYNSLLRCNQRVSLALHWDRIEYELRIDIFSRPRSNIACTSSVLVSPSWLKLLTLLTMLQNKPSAQHRCI